MPRFFWQSKDKPKKKGPENEGPMIELNDMTGYEVRKRQRDEEEARKKAAEEQHNKDRKKVSAELEFAASLYDANDVKEAGKKAFSKISTLLVRYNRLQDIKRDNKINAQEARDEENKSYESEMARLNYEEEEINKALEENKDGDVSDHKEKLRNIAESRRKLRIRHDSVLKKIDKEEHGITNEEKTLLDQDRGGIRSALMLGGKTSAGMGYTLTEGSQADIIKARNYIDEQGSEEGSLMGQMSLLDNAVNTGGIDLEQRGKGKTEGIAHANLSEILRNLTADELEEMNSGRGEKLNINMEMLDKSKKDPQQMDKLFGAKKDMDGVRDAAGKRGVTYVREDSKSEGARNYLVGKYNSIRGGINSFRKNHPVLGAVFMAAPVGTLMDLYQPRKRVTMKQHGLTPEAIARAKGKAGAYNDPEKAKRIIRSFKGNSGILDGFFSHGASINRKIQVGSYSSPQQRREQMRAERQALFDRIKDRNEKGNRKNSGQIKVNENEKFNDAMREIRSNDSVELQTRVKTNELTAEKAESLGKLDNIDFIIKKRSEQGEGDTNATHMLATYKVLGASAQELLDFRLALIAYMVPSGKKTVAEIVNESHEAGVVGAEGPDKVSEDTDMEKLFAQLRKKADYVERVKEKENGIGDYQWTVDKKKFRKTENGPEETKEEEKKEPGKEEEKKQEPDKEEEEEYKGPVHIFDIRDEQFKNGAAGEEGAAPEDEPLFGYQNEIKATDVRAADSGNRFLLAALASLAESDPGYIRKKLIVENPDKTVTVRLYDQDGAPVWYKISRKRVNDGVIRGPLWVHLVEKAASVILSKGDNGVGYRPAAQEGQNIKFSAEDIAGGSEELAMQVLLGKDKVKTVNIEGEYAVKDKAEIQARAKTLADDIDKARKSGRMIIAKTYTREKLAKDGLDVLRNNALRADETYSVTGQGYGMNGEPSVRLRDINGPSLIETSFTGGKPVEKIVDDAVIEIPASAFLKCFLGMSMGSYKKAAPEKEEKKEEEKKEEKKEELFGINEALTMLGAGEGIAIIDKWKELGNRLWKAAYVELGKGGLESMMNLVDDLINYLTQPLPKKLDGSNNAFIAERASNIETKYKTIVYEAVELADKLANMDFDESEEAARAAVELSNNAISESRYFVRGCNIVADKLSGEGFKEKKAWLEMVMTGKEAMLKSEEEEKRKKQEEQEKREEQERRDIQEIREAQERRKRQEEQERQTLADGDELQAADELPTDAGRKTEFFAAKDPFEDRGYFDEPLGGNEKRRKRRGSLAEPVNRISIPDEEEPEKLQEEEQALENPNDLQAELYGGGVGNDDHQVLIRRTERDTDPVVKEEVFEDPLGVNVIKRVGGKLNVTEEEPEAKKEEQEWQVIGKEADLNDAQEAGGVRHAETEKKTVAEEKKEVPLKDQGWQMIGEKEAAAIRIAVPAKKLTEEEKPNALQTELYEKEADLNDAQEVRDARRTERQTNPVVQKVEEEEDKEGLNDIRRVDAKKVLVEEEKAEAPGNEAAKKERLSIVEKGPGKGVRLLNVLAGLEGEKKAEEKPEEKDQNKEGMFADAETVEMNAASYIALWKYLKDRLTNSIGEMFADKKKAEVFGKMETQTNKVKQSLDTFIRMLDGEVSAAGNRKLFTNERKQIDFLLNYFSTMCSDLSFRMMDEKIDNTEAAKTLLMISNTAYYVREYIKAGAQEEAGNKKPGVKKWADILVNGKKIYDKKTADRLAKQQKDKEPVQEDKAAGPGEDEILPGLNDEEKLPGREEERGNGPVQDEEKAEEEEKIDAEDLDKRMEALEKEFEEEEKAKEKAKGKPEGEVKPEDEAKPEEKPEPEDEDAKKIAAQHDELRQEFDELQRQNEEQGKKILEVFEGKKGKKKTSEKAVEPEHEEKEEEQQADKDAGDVKAGEMQALEKGAQIVGKQSFVPIATGEKIKNRIVSAAKYTWGAAMLPVNLIVAGISKLFLIGRKKKRSGKEQQDRSKENRKNIAGRENGFLSDKDAPKDKNGNIQVYDDVTHVPLVWEFVTAGDTKESPEMSINVEQPVAGKTKTSSGIDVGHTFISLTYNRFNASTNRDERYKLEYGFYPKDGFGGLGLTMAQGTKAVIPGMLKNDKGHDYNISKRYNITTEKVNDVLKASEKYSAQGYNVFTRNCTTFAVQMGRLAGIPVADKMEESEYEMGNAARVGATFVGGLAPSARYTSEIDFEKMLSEDDMGYENFGQKMGTVDEIDRFKNSRELMPHTPRGYSPAVAGEMLRRDTGEEGILGINNTNEKFDDDFKTMSEKGKELKEILLSSFKAIAKTPAMVERDKAEQVEEKKAAYYITQMVSDKIWKALNNIDDPSKQGALQQLKEIRSGMKACHKDFSSFVVRNPEYAEPNMENVSKYMTLMETVLRSLDSLYEKNLKADYTGDLGFMRAAYQSVKMPLKYKDKKGNTHSIEMEPSLIEAYLQMFGSMDKAALHMAEYSEYSIEKDRDGITDEESKALNKRYREAIRIHKTAVDFAASHRYRMNKITFDEKDFEYAFKQLPEMETPEKGASLAGDMIEVNALPSSMVQSMVFERVFAGVLSEIIKNQKQAVTVEQKAALTENCMIECAKKGNNNTELKKILEYFRKDAADGTGSKAIADRFMDVLMKSYVPNMLLGFDSWAGSYNKILQYMREHRDSALYRYIRELAEEMIVGHVNEIFGFIDEE